MSARHLARTPRLRLAVDNGGPDHGPQHQHATGRLEVVEAPDPQHPKRGKVRRAQVSDSVRLAVRRGTMPYRCWMAAERFRRDLEMAEADVRIPSQIAPRITYDKGPDGRDHSVDWVAARERVTAAWRAIGPIHAGVIAWCVAPKPEGGARYGTLSGYAECMGIRKATACEALDRALHRLADHYGIGAAEAPEDFA